MERRWWLARAIRKRRELSSVQDNTSSIRRNSILLFATMRNERVRLPYFMKYYRNLGVDHFLFVDNDSDDGSLQALLGQDDVSIWHTTASYKRARFGVDWINFLQMRYAHQHWCLVVGTVSKTGKIAEIGYWIRSDETSKGICTEAATAVLGEAFGRLGFHKVVMRIAMGNEASHRVAEKLGFTREGVLREELLIRGNWVDHAQWSMIDREFSTLRRTRRSTGSTSEA